jgi:sulfur relay (sulfurtransferase) complex TusBCD TusD component (DsrE family)
VKLGIVISTNEPETAFNGLRLANYALGQGDEVRVFLLGKGVELDQIQDEKFSIRQQAESLLEAGGTIQACGTCLKLRLSAGSDICPLSTMKDLYEIVRDCDRLVTL